MKLPNLTPAVSPKYLSDETQIYIFVNRIHRVVYRIFLGFFKIFIFPTLGRYLQTSALKVNFLDLGDASLYIFFNIERLFSILELSLSSWLLLATAN